MRYFPLALRLAAAVVCIPASPARAIFDADNIGQWNTPTEIGPDKAVPGFLVNLGPTGARAILKDQSFLIKHIFPDSPADQNLRLDDEILGVNGRRFSKHTFGKFYGMDNTHGIEGPIMDLGLAIEDSEGTDGRLKLDVQRAGEPVEVTIQLKPIGRFSATYPARCKKSETLARAAMDYVLAHQEDYGGEVHEKGMVGLALLAHGKLKEAEEFALNWNTMPGETQWTWYPSYQCIFLSEYFLRTGDKRVLDTIGKLCERLYLSQVIDPELYKDRMHGGEPQAKNFLRGGNGHGARIAGYGTMTITTLMALLCWELAEDCGIEIKDFNRDIAYECIHTHTHESGYMGYRFATGAYTPVGRQGLSLIVHKVANRNHAPDHVKAVASGLAAARTRLNDGHGDNVLAWAWALIGAQLAADPRVMRDVFDYNTAFINMARTHDGAFVAQPGRNRHEKAYYISPRIHPTAAMAIVLNADHPTLRIQGVAR